MRTKRITMWLVFAALVCMASQVQADDKKFLQQRAGAPNILIVLDSSGSMNSTPETASDTANDFLMPPGTADDPYSRMGIAKRVLRNFLSEISSANLALATYYKPTMSSNHIPSKHWAYEAKGQDSKFRMIEKNYVYRIGANEDYDGSLLDNPAEYLESQLIGYNPYFDPRQCLAEREEDGDCPAGEGNPAFLPYETRYGPTNAYDAAGENFDLLPIYFGTSVRVDGSTYYNPRIFPFFDQRYRDPEGNFDEEANSWAYRFLNCVPYITSTADNPDDGCKSLWLVGQGDERTHYQRRARLYMPETIDSAANHPLGIDTTGSPSGNQEVTDDGVENYDLNAATLDDDYDGDNTNDWVLYIEAQEEQRTTVCSLLTSLVSVTPIPSGTPTPTPTPNSQCSIISLSDFVPHTSGRGELTTTITNNSSDYSAYITRTYLTWLDYPSDKYVDRFYWTDGDSHWRGNDGSPPTDIYTTRLNNRRRIWDSSSRQWVLDFQNGVETVYGETTVCFDFHFTEGRGGDRFDLTYAECPNFCITYNGPDPPP